MGADISMSKYFTHYLLVVVVCSGIYLPPYLDAAEPVETNKKNGQPEQSAPPIPEYSKDADKEKAKPELSSVLTPLPVVTESKDIKNRLDSFKITVDLKDVSFEEAVEYFRIIGGMNFIIDRRIYEDDKKPKNVNLQFKETILKTALKLMITNQGYRCFFKQGSLLILPAGIYDDDEFVTLTYNIPDLLAPPPPDFPGPDLTLPNTGDKIGWIAPPIEETPREPITEEDIKKTVEVKTGLTVWADERSGWTIIRKQFLVVTQTMDIHNQIVETLNELRLHKR